MSFPNSKSPKPEAEAAAEPLRALRRGLARAEGFGLYVAVFKTPAQRNQLIKLLQEAMPATRLLTVAIRPGTKDILDEVVTQLGNEIKGPIMLVGLEEVIATESPDQPVLYALNLRRPDWPLLVRQPVVFWVPEYLLGILGRAAPDFLDWRSDTVHFPETEMEQLEMLQSATWNGGAETRMPAEARRERVKELESRIAANEHSGDRVVLAAVANWLNELGMHLTLFGRTKEASEYFQKAILILQQLGDLTGEGIALTNLGNSCRKSGDLAKAKEAYQKALTISRKTGNRLLEAGNLGNLGILSRNQGDLRKAMEFQECQLKIARELGDRRNAGNAIEAIALVCHEQGDIHKSIELHNQALNIYRDLGDLQGEGIVLGNLGICYATLGEVPKAIEFQEQRLVIARAIGDRHGEEAALGNLGNAYGMAGDPHKAVVFFERHLGIAREIGDRRGECISLGNLGNAYNHLEERRKAIEIFDLAFEIAQEINDERLEAYCLWESAVAFKKLNDLPNAIVRAEAALRIFESIHDVRANLVRENLAKWRAATASVVTPAEGMKP